MTSALLASGPDDSLLLADFPASLGRLEWRVVNDGVMGGRSEGGFEPEGEALLFTGTTNTDGGGFSSIRSATRRFDLGGYDGIRLRVWGDGRSYTFRLTTWEARRRAYEPSYWAEFGTRGGDWETVDIPFSRFRPRWRGRWLDGPELDPAAVDGLGLMIYDGKDGSFRLEVDWIRAYRAPRPFSMDAFRWQRRPLLLFAGDEGDAHLQRQLAAVEATREPLRRARHGAGRRPDPGTLPRRGSDAERRGCRPPPGSYGVEEGSFALRLVGKDGGVKRSDDEFVPVDALYDQIDSMPMRQQEMRQ